ncbi:MULTISPECIES: hypothetical protein [unclassified Mesorhizobium]|uniref:hypothetical protein n=1 Tax=unclassified Mesorhizobium TaxID=325217 RepID=UPI0003D0444D|nr:hypothetical protein [Mesorhizobium sp. L103C105A0]ESZ76504.1 hypothetical protein X726_14130 [Mesorhizobium sp. L103C105A0]
MAPLPKGFSLQAIPIESALSEGRIEDAKTLLIDLLRSGKAGAVVQRLAADMLKPSKRPRGRTRALPRHWIDIGEQFNGLRNDGVRYEEAMRRMTEKFGYSETHVRGAVATYDRAKEDQDRE